MGINPNQLSIVDNTGSSATEGSVIVSSDTGDNIWSSNATGSIIIPVGNSSQRNSIANTGRLRINTDISAPEISINNSWKTFGQLNFPGTVTAPGISFALDTGTGFYEPASHQLGLSVNGAARALWTSSQFSVYTPTVITGTLTNAGVIFASYPGTTVGLTVNRSAGQPATFLYNDTNQTWSAGIGGNGIRIKTNAVPTDSDDLANKAYVDAVVSGGGQATTTSFGTVKLATLSQASNGNAGLVATTDVAKSAVYGWLDARFGANNSLIWTPSHQGSGTGMDADLLDGQHGSYYATSSSVNGKVSLAGDTMTGLLTLSGAPTSNLHAATKLYVDTAVSSATLSPSQILAKLVTVDGPNSTLDADFLDGQHGAYYADIPSRLGFTPVQQGGGTSQSNNKLYIGWSGSSQLRLQVDSTDFGSVWPITSQTTNSVNGVTLQPGLGTGNTPTFAGQGLTGALYFGGPYGNTDNTDPTYIVKNDPYADISELACYIGDNGLGPILAIPTNSSADFFTIRSNNDGIHHMFGTDGSYVNANYIVTPRMVVNGTATAVTPSTSGTQGGFIVAANSSGNSIIQAVTPDQATQIGWLNMTSSGIYYNGQQLATSGSGSLAATGYQVLPNGLILQWGSFSNGYSLTNQAFPITFPTACLMFSVSNTNSQGVYVDNAFGYAVSSSQFYIGCKASPNGSISSYAVSWFAIGN